MLLRLFVILLVGSSIARAEDPTFVNANPKIERDCERLFGNPRSFLIARTWHKEPGIEPAFFVEPEEMHVILSDQRRVLVQGFKVGVTIANKLGFHNAIRTEDNAKIRVDSIVKMVMRRSMGEETADTIRAYDLVTAVKKYRLTESLVSLGLELALIDTERSSFKLELTPCKEKLSTTNNFPPSR